MYKLIDRLNLIEKYEWNNWLIAIEAAQKYLASQKASDASYAHHAAHAAYNNTDDMTVIVNASYIAKREIYLKIINYGIGLLNEQIKEEK